MKALILIPIVLLIATYTGASVRKSRKYIRDIKTSVMKKLWRNHEIRYRFEPQPSIFVEKYMFKIMVVLRKIEQISCLKFELLGIREKLPPIGVGAGLMLEPVIIFNKVTTEQECFAVIDNGRIKVLLHDSICGSSIDIMAAIMAVLGISVPKGSNLRLWDLMPWNLRDFNDMKNNCDMENALTADPPEIDWIPPSTIRELNLAFCRDACQAVQECYNGGVFNPKICGQCICPEGFAGSLCQELARSSTTWCTGNPQTLNDQTQEIDFGTRDLGQESYVPPQDCTWMFTAPEGRTIIFEFKRNHFGYNCTRECICRDYLEVRNAQDMSVKGYRFCCSLRPKKRKIISKSNKLMVVQRIQNSGSRGFKASVYLADEDDLAEIDKCIKKIQEGVDEFDEIWAKVQEATNANQKEKFETDLKKEIKKLQRLREQVKNWIASGDIKDKTQLSEYRRVIELKMEQFKVVERETKTKAYSKQGLGAEQKLDPKEKEKEDTIYWLQESIDRLSQQIDKFEAEIEHITAGAGKKRKLDKEKQDKIDDLKRHLERHRYHIQKLELLMRLVTNSSLEPVQVRKIHDDLEYYITNNEEQDFEENDFMYDDLNLGDVEQLAQQMGTLSFNQDDLENNSETNTTTSVSPSASPAPSLNSKDSNTRESEEGKARHVSEGVEEVVKPVVTRGVSSTVSRSTPTTPLKLTSQLSLDSAVSTPPSTGTPPLAPTVSSAAVGMSYNSVAAGVSKSATKMSTVSSLSSATSAASRVAATTSASFEPSKAPSTPVRTTTTTTANAAELAAAAAAATTIVAANSSASLSYVATSTLSQTAAALNQAATNAANVTKTPSAGSTEDSSPAVVSNGPSTDSRKSLEDAKILNEKPSSTATLPNPGNPSLNSTAVSISHATPSSVANISASNIAAASLLTNSNANSVPLPPGNVMNASVLMGYNALNSATQLQQQQQQQKTQEANIPPLLGASPLGKVQITQEHATQLSALEHSMRHPPLPSDSERLRTHLPRSPCQVPPHYPQTPPPLSDVLEYFNHLQPETLFFIFYYLEGTKAQYLAARALKRQSWRFHTKYMMWFQRHEEPKTITEEFEQGTYIYFDFEKWAQRRKEGFTFEYRYLEDKELS